MGGFPAHRDAAPSGPPAFRDRAEAGVLLGARLREVTGKDQTDDPERVHVSATPPVAAAYPDEARPVVFAIPRGGVAVAVGVARALGAPLDVLMVRKIGHPLAPELGLGAIAADGAGGAADPFFDAEMLARVGLTVDDLAEVVARERAELARRVAVYTRQPALSSPRAEPPAPVRTEERRPGNEGRASREDRGPGRAEASEGNIAGASLAGQLVIVVDDGLATGVTARAALRAVRARGAARTVLAVPVAALAAVRAIENETGEVVTLVTPRRFRSVGEWYADFGQLTDDDVLALLQSSPGGTTPVPPDVRRSGPDRKERDRIRPAPADESGLL